RRLAHRHQPVERGHSRRHHMNRRTRAVPVHPNAVQHRPKLRSDSLPADLAEPYRLARPPIGDDHDRLLAADGNGEFHRPAEAAPSNGEVEVLTADLRDPFAFQLARMRPEPARKTVEPVAAEE